MLGYDFGYYYDRLGEMVERMENGDITTEEFDKTMLKILDEELTRDQWLKSHFNSTASYLYNNIKAGDFDRPFDEYVKIANDEIEIFKKHGLDTEMMEEDLAIAIEEYAKAV